MSLTISEAQDKAIELEEDIKRLIIEFEEEAGTEISTIEIKRQDYKDVVGELRQKVDIKLNITLCYR